MISKRRQKELERHIRRIRNDRRLWDDPEWAHRAQQVIDHAKRRIDYGETLTEREYQQRYFRGL